MKKISEELDGFGMPLMEMARLGTYEGYDFRIYTEPLGNPSFHLASKDFEIVITIKDLSILEVKRCDKSKYKFTKGEKLSGAVLKSVHGFMAQKVPHTNLTRKEYIIPVWNDNNPGYQIGLDYIEW